MSDGLQWATVAIIGAAAFAHVARQVWRRFRPAGAPSGSASGPGAGCGSCSGCSGGGCPSTRR